MWPAQSELKKAGCKNPTRFFREVTLGVRPHVFLSDRLPLPESVERSASSSHATYSHHPSRLKLWEVVKPCDALGADLVALLDDIIRYQNVADSVYQVDNWPLRNLCPPLEDLWSFDNESSVVTVLSHQVLVPLLKLARLLPGASTARWKLHTSNSHLAPKPEELVGAFEQMGGQEVLKFFPDFKFCVDCFPGGASGPGGGSGRSGPDGGSGPGDGSGHGGGGHGGGRPLAREDLSDALLCCLCVGVAKAYDVLLTSRGEPLPLLELWRQGEHRARNLVSQVYTYMLDCGTLYGFLTCYAATWIFHCPAEDRSTLFVSPPFLAGAKHTPEKPRATARGALAYLLLLSVTNKAQLPPRMLIRKGDGSRGGRGAGSSGAASGGSDSGPERKGAAAADRSFRGAANSSKRTLAPSSGARGQPEEPQERPHLERMLCDGYGGGIVALGTVGDRPAVVKLLGPSAAAIQAYHTEREAYDLLAELQGSVLPELLAAGRTFDDLNVYFIATALVPGETLWQVLGQRWLQPEEMAAAVGALQQLHAARPGFLHGDVRLENVMLLRREPGEAARCMVLDLGLSRLDGSEEEQRAEVRGLRELLGHEGE
ncbi:hypothetical protein GPECTOR_40g549 [Gonium pectorale]|uniref:Protein kinase domain-containing protein n=1 Tax=Gonium pectorale TaxID=33097 RepID=A0A150GB58_GONPE|nr:hypothetical protein GPECTOR_40g549 [Gonium pectorale]|eukprot:KXZ46815.1 hypothetical protein GPECTOR_40g549 [Gonium pectorale]